MEFLRGLNKVSKATVGLILAGSFLGCGATDVTANGPRQAPNEANCDFEIMTSSPLIGYKEIGTIDVTPGGYGDHVFQNLSDFKDHIRPNVCELGGDAALAFANGNGWYIKASVLKRVAAKPAASEPAPAPVAVAAKRESHGCEFDSQCKGDRICVEGKCQSPAPSAAPAESAPTAAVPAPAASAPAPTAAKSAANAAKPATSATKPAAPAAAAKPAAPASAH